MGRIKKRRNAILEAVGGLFKSDARRKKLKKARAFRTFIEKLEARRDVLSRELYTTPEASQDERAPLRRQLDTIDEQLPNARKLLRDMEEKERKKKG